MTLTTEALAEAMYEHDVQPLIGTSDYRPWSDLPPAEVRVYVRRAEFVAKYAADERMAGHLFMHPHNPFGYRGYYR